MLRPQLTSAEGNDMNVPFAINSFGLGEEGKGGSDGLEAGEGNSEA